MTIFVEEAASITEAISADAFGGAEHEGAGLTSMPATCEARYESPASSTSMLWELATFTSMPTSHL